MHDPQLVKEEEGIISHPFPFADDDVLTNVSDLEYEDDDEHNLDIENEPQVDPDPYPTHAPNKRPKWAQKLIEAVGNSDGDPYDIGRTRSQYHDENLALNNSNPLILKRCFMMMGSDPQSYTEDFHVPR